MTPQKFNEMKLSVTMLAAAIAEMELEAFLNTLALAGAEVPSDPQQLQSLEVLASALLRVKETTMQVRSGEERKDDLAMLRNVPSPIEEMERLVGLTQSK